MRARPTVLLLTLGLPGVGLGQFLSGTSGSASSATAYDRLQYTPMGGGTITVENYYGLANGYPGVSIGSNHAFSNVLLPGAGGLTSGSEGGSVVDSLQNGVLVANYSANLTAQAFLGTSVSTAGSDREVTASVSGQAREVLAFTLGATAQMDISGLAGLSPGGAGSVELFLTDIDSGLVTVIDSNLAGTFTDVLNLDPGSYTLTGLAVAASGFDINLFQGVVSNTAGSYSADLNYTAKFESPSPAPEPATYAFVATSLFGVLRYRRLRRSRAG